MATMFLDSASRLTSQEAVGSGRISTIKNPTARDGGKEHKEHFTAPIDISCGDPSIKGCKRMVRLVSVILREYFRKELLQVRSTKTNRNASRLTNKEAFTRGTVDRLILNSFHKSPLRNFRAPVERILTNEVTCQKNKPFFRKVVS